MSQLLKQLQSAKHEGYLKGLADGKEAEKAVLFIALNEIFNFGGDRLSKVEQEEQWIWKNEVFGNMDTGALHIQQRLNQIRGVDCKEGNDDKRSR